MNGTMLRSGCFPAPGTSMELSKEPCEPAWKRTHSPHQTRPMLRVHQAAASLTENRRARCSDLAPHRRSTWPMYAEPFEETIVDQESDRQQSGAVSGPISQR